MKTLLRIQFTLLLTVLALSICLTSCSLIIAARQTNPNWNGPSVIEQWWNDQQPKR